MQDQPFQILVLMLDKPGEVVTRDEIRHRLWPDGTFVDFEHSLNAAIKRLRAALGDSAENPRFVETLHRRGYRFIAPVNGIVPRGIMTGRAHESEKSATRKCRILILPFVNMSTESEQEYFSDGLTEEMIAQLGRMHPRQLGVIARTSAMLFKRAGKTVAQIGREMDVTYVLEGSVRCDGGRVRITAQLIETEGQTHLWADSYERSFQDSLSVQSEVAGRIARALANELLPAEFGTLVQVGPSNTEAYHTYLKGRYHWNMPGDEGVEKGDRVLREGTDARSVLCARRTPLWHVRTWPGRTRRTNLVGSCSRTLERRRCEPSSWIPRQWKGISRSRKCTSGWTGIGWQRRTAIAPRWRSIPAAMPPIARTECFSLGWPVTTKPSLKPSALSSWIRLCLTVNSSAAWVCYVARQYDRVIAWCRHTLEMRPEFVPARRFLAAAYLQTGRVAEAIAELEDTIRQAGAEPVLVAWLAHARAIEGDRAESLAGLQELRQLADMRYVSAYQTSLVYVGLGDIDGAFASLEQACARIGPAVSSISASNRGWIPFVAIARYGVLVRRLGLPVARPQT